MPTQRESGSNSGGGGGTSMSHPGPGGGGGGGGIGGFGSPGGDSAHQVRVKAYYKGEREVSLQMMKQKLAKENDLASCRAAGVVIPHLPLASWSLALRHAHMCEKLAVWALCL